MSSFNCAIPEIIIVNGTDVVSAALETYKSYPVILTGKVTLLCGVTLENTKRWSIMEVDPLSGEEIREVSISELPSR